MKRYKNPVFLRPRRFGKSLLCTTLTYYYDINEKDNFQQLFGHTRIGKNPSPEHNRYMILTLDFSVVDASGTIEDIRYRFDQYCNIRLRTVTLRYRKYFETPIEIDMNKDTAINLQDILAMIETFDLPRLYVIIDEYDNFANQLITSHRDALYRELTADDSFLLTSCKSMQKKQAFEMTPPKERHQTDREWVGGATPFFKNFFKSLKNGTKDGTIARTFITGVLPITIDDLASAYNIAEFITLEEKFETMTGFTLEETGKLLDEIYRDYEIEPSTRELIMEVITSNYNGYRMVNPKINYLAPILFPFRIAISFHLWYIIRYGLCTKRTNR